MTDKVQKIREEVARIQLFAQSEVLKDILDYIDKVQEEPVSEDLEEVAETYALDDYIKPWRELVKRAFKAGAKWQKAKDNEEKVLIYKHGFDDCKEQMIAKAKSGTVQKDNQVILDNGTYIDLDPSMQLKPSFVGLKEGDRIKVIIIKEG